jgi:HPt (histidine-containing phosphotransfer) domain-containing protein
VDNLNGDFDATVDWNIFSRTRSELGAAFVRILGYFREDGEKAVGRIEDAVQRRDAAALVIPAHTLKSEARQFGAELLGMLAETIENSARRAVEMRTFPDDLIPEVAKLRPLYLRTIDELDREANPLLQRRPGFGNRG